MKTVYFDFNGIPAFLEYKKFPVKIVKGKSIIEYNLQKFFTYAQVISPSKYTQMIKDQK